MIEQQMNTFDNKTNLPLLCPMEYSEPIKDMHWMTMFIVFVESF